MHATRTQRLGSLLATLVAVGALAASCGGGSSDSAGAVKDDTGSTTSAPPGDARITTLDAPAAVACNGTTSTKVTVSYATVGAASKQLLVDGLRIDGTDAAEGQLDVPVHCDQLPHTVVLIAKDGNGGTTVKQTMVTTDLGAG